MTMIKKEGSEWGDWEINNNNELTIDVSTKFIEIDTNKQAVLIGKPVVLSVRQLSSILKYMDKNK